MSSLLQTLLPVLVGVAVVVAGILVFRLHAFFALLLAAAVTAGLTSPRDMVLEEMRAEGKVVSYLGIERPWAADLLQRHPVQYVLTAPEASDPAAGLPLGGSFYVGGRPFAPRRVGGGNRWVVVDRGYREGADRPKAELRIHAYSRRVIHGKETRIALAHVSDGSPSVMAQNLLLGRGSPLTSYFRPEKSDPVVRQDALAELSNDPRPPAATRIASAFGDTVGSIGLLIAFAAVIGMCLLDSGAADRIVRSALKLVGERGAPAAFMSCGFLLGVPVFFDMVFLLLIPLGKALRLRTGRNYLLYVLTIFCGATMAHSLVPPTPGPLLVAERLGVNVGTMIVVGSAVGLIVATYGVFHAWIANRLIDVPLRDTPEMPLADLERLAAKPDHELPPLWASLLPIALPLVLIAQAATLEVLRKNEMTVFGDVVAMAGWQMTLIDTLGEKTTAVGIGLVAALVLLMRQSRQTLGQLQGRVGAAVASGGSIILITAAGGAFGQMIEQTGVASLVKGLPGLGPVGLLAVAFGVTAAIRTAQGSATVAMITAVGIFGGMSLPFHAVWLALAIGCGSKPLSWMPDSGFWVICKMSGMTEAETLKTLTPMTGMLGLVGLATVIVGATLFPMK